MASSLASRAAASAERTSSLWRTSITSFLRNLSTSSTSTPNATNPSSISAPSAAAANQSKRKKKKKNLFEVAQFLPNWGLGFHMAKTHWSNVSYEITKINLYKDGRHGKAWGIAYKDGSPAAPAKKISGVNKRCWKYIPNSKKIEEGTSKPGVQLA